jgi:heat shock protein HtpX
MNPFLDPDRHNAHKRRNRWHSLLLVGGIGLILLVSAALIWSWTGALFALLVVVLIAAFGPRVPPETMMRLYRARPVDPRHGGQLTHIVEVLADRAELPTHPRLYVVPSMTLNAFATGNRDRAAIAVTEGLLRRLSLRELAGVLAHEMSHIRNNDLAVMGLADAVTRFTQVMSYMALVLAIPIYPRCCSAMTRGSRGARSCCCIWRRRPRASCSSACRVRASTTRTWRVPASPAIRPGSPRPCARSSATRAASGRI